MEAELFGREVSFEYSETWVGYSLLILRLIMGWVFFYAGVTKVLNPEWSAEGFLLNAVPEANPFTGFWTALATDWLWLVDPLNAWGLTLVGAALILGVAVRWSAFWGAVMMVFYWLASFPLEHAILMDAAVVWWIPSLCWPAQRANTREASLCRSIRGGPRPLSLRHANP